MAETNVERLLKAGAITSADDISEEHKNALNNDFTPEEVDAIIKLKNKIVQQPFVSDNVGGGAMF